jgi:hypothetical protein
MIRVVSASLLFLLAACAGGDEGSFPSLAPRAAEKQGFAEPETAAPVATPDPALDRQLAEVRSQLDAVRARFDEQLAAAERRARAAAGQAAGSEAWIAAQTALAELDGVRADASAVATDAEQLAIARAATLAPAYPDLDAAQERARGEVEREDAAIRRLTATLAPA